MMHHDADVPTIAPDGPPKFSCCCDGLAALRARHRARIKPDADQGGGLDTGTGARK
jgi:hypothetical protein